MNPWTLILLVFTAGDPTPKGVTLGGHLTEHACLKRAAQDNKRVQQTYPPGTVEQLQWACVQREPMGTAKKLPEVGGMSTDAIYHPLNNPSLSELNKPGMLVGHGASHIDTGRQRAVDALNDLSSAALDLQRVVLQREFDPTGRAENEPGASHINTQDDRLVSASVLSKLTRDGVRAASAEEIADLDSRLNRGAGQAQSALDRQEGGSHYKDMAIQPFEYIHANGFDFGTGAAIKYLSRWRAKNGIEDLKKARHFIDLLIEAEQKKATKS